MLVFWNRCAREPSIDHLTTDEKHIADTDGVGRLLEWGFWTRYVLCLSATLNLLGQPGI